jgi:hypothetical protein
MPPKGIDAYDVEIMVYHWGGIQAVSERIWEEVL